MTNDKSKAGSTGRFSATRDFKPKQESIRISFNRLRAKANSQPTSSDSGTITTCCQKTKYLNTNTEAAVDRINIEETEHDNVLDDHVDSVEPEEVEENEVEDFITDILPRGSYLASYFEKIQARLSTEEYPSEYERGTFWIEPMMSYFIHKNNKKIEDIYQLRVFLWIPHLLIDEKLAGLCCPTCDSKIETKGYNKLPHARRIVDLQRYRCLSPRCGKAFNGHSDSIISQLPYEPQMEFPAVLTHKGGVSKTVGDLLRPCIQNSVGPKRFQKILLELHHIHHDRLELQYLISTFRNRNGVARYFSRSSPELFSSLENQNQYADYVPTDTYFRTLTLSLSDITLRVPGQRIEKDGLETHRFSLLLSSKQIAYTALGYWDSISIFRVVK
ncbi:hypothetical protein INT47_000702 [Mucor saturninus]|uniref:DUF6729 domain-containing protein n=1 Tax=Mucor saturninus TaxID=64648 RepID=A0A8H7RLG1_9FUNG|nr:hypothetical protein INT47_000702 [Mucor saturninus]